MCHFLEKSNYNVISIHGDKKQFQRQEAIQKFTNGDVPILIATDVASRGLDFPKVSYVFNYDMPSNIDAYIHRIGRTGRGGDKGVAVSFINDNCKNIVKSLFHLLKNQNQEIPEWFERMFKNCGSLISSGRDNYGNRNKSDRDHNFLNRKRKEDMGYSNQVNAYSGYGGQPQNKTIEKTNGYYGNSLEKPDYDYNKYSGVNNFTSTTYPTGNNTIPMNIPNTFSNNIPSNNLNNYPNSTTSAINSNQLFPSYYQQPYNNILPKFNYNNVGYYPGQNFNALGPQSQMPSSQKPVDPNYDGKKDLPQLKFIDNNGESNSLKPNESKREEINLIQNEWLDLKEYSERNSSKNQISSSDQNRHGDERRERSREYNRSRDYDRDRERNRDNDRNSYRYSDSNRSGERDRERNRDRSREHHHRSSRDSDRDRSRERHHRSSRENDNYRRSRPDDRYNK